jgi:membrane associated rhomboid family serine protease
MLFPIGDDNSRRRGLPVVTYGLIALNVIVFLMELSAGESFIRQWAVVPSRLTADPAGNFLTVFTAMFMHGGWLHLLGNMRMGQAKFLGFYLLCGIVATLAQVAFTPGSSIPNLGASGAIAGVLAAYLVLFPRQQVRVMMGRGVVALPALIVIGLWFVLQFINSMGAIANTVETGGVAYMAHIGGFIAGFILTYLLRGSYKRAATA